jgi:hypothetical protein
MRSAVRRGVCAAIAAGSWTIGATATATTTAPPVQALSIGAEAPSTQPLIVVQPPHSGPFTLTPTSENLPNWNSIPSECAPGSHATEQVLTIEDRAPQETTRLTRSVLHCRLGMLDSGTVHTIAVPAHTSGTPPVSFIASLHSDETLIDQTRWSAPSATGCAPPGRAPTKRPGSRSLDGNDVSTVAGPEHVEANGRISGYAPPGSVLSLTGLDMCEHRIERTLIVPANGQFRFVGLLPGRYALLDADGRVLHRADLDDATHVVDGLIVHPTDPTQHEDHITAG